MKLNEINIRDPFIINENGKYYMYGTRARNFGVKTGGFDVYISTDLENWSNPIECFDSEKFGLNSAANWAPEVHFYNGKYYMLATFEQKNGLRGTFCCVSENPTGPFVLNSQKALTPDGWECLDGTLYISKDNIPYLVFSHEHTQIIDGTICYIQLNEDLTDTIGEARLMFKASEPFYIEASSDKDKHYVTDGPFLFRNKNGELILIWSTFIEDNYAECIAKSLNGEIDGEFVHLPPLSNAHGGHGMVFNDNGLKFVMHCPNTQGEEKPVIYSVIENDSEAGIALKAI